MDTLVPNDQVQSPEYVLTGVELVELPSQQFRMYVTIARLAEAPLLAADPFTNGSECDHLMRVSNEIFASEGKKSLEPKVIGSHRCLHEVDISLRRIGPVVFVGLDACPPCQRLCLGVHLEQKPVCVGASTQEQQAA